MEGNQRKYTKEEATEIAKIYHEYVQGQKISFVIEGGAGRFYRGILPKMKKYPEIFEDDIRCIENALKPD
ncbi:MAG TPA: hypothetical protein VJ485_04115 [archaeon]|jgi:hypothetical protein|nr:hypothetical protein [archaeon]